MSEEECLHIIGQKILEDRSRSKFPNRERDYDFTCKNKRYKALVEVDFKSLSRDVGSSCDFYLQSFPGKNGQELLGIFHDEWMVCPTRRTSNPDSSIRLLTLIFSDIQNAQLRLKIDDSDTAENKYITTELYDLLRVAHTRSSPNAPIDLSEINESLNITLRPYQSRAVQWLYSREKEKDFLSSEYQKITSRKDAKTFYLNVRNLRVHKEMPSNFLLPTGGILADEMGLGKTVEMLALILLNKRRDIPAWKPLNLSTDPPPNKISKVVKCICGKSSTKDCIQCVNCLIYQHSPCVQSFESDTEKPFICPQCWQNESLVESGATLIVSPCSIKLQWASEIRKHLKTELRILLYDGVSNKKWISPLTLSEYDIILTDYTILQKEVHFASASKYNLTFRNSQKYMRVDSPLTMVHWWRVCLDEAQMVESQKTQAAQMVKTLPAINRWAVTGTPINKSIDDLLGLFDFLDVTPLCDKMQWYSFVYEFQRNKTKELVDNLQKIMWRTCKHSVENELHIPPQNEEIHFVTMSDVQKLFYKSQHENCSVIYEERIEKHISSNVPLSQITPKTLKTILEPLRKLRQDCTVPALLRKSEQSVVKKLLQPKELLDHLISTNELDCKFELRSMVSSYNGLAALHFIKNNYQKAIGYYKVVLRLAGEYTGNVCVDSLLQIHAMHNLIEASKNVPQHIEYLKTYGPELSKLEWKYMQTYKNLLVDAVQSFNKLNDSVENLRQPVNQHCSVWADVLVVLSPSDVLITRINEEKKNGFENVAFEDFQSAEGVIYVLCRWVTDVLENRSTIVQTFENFKYFIENVKAKQEQSEEVQHAIKEFVNRIFLCHLNATRNKNEKKNEKKKLCQLCDVRKLLDQYECLIFNKTQNERTAQVEGSWNPTFQETVMKMVTTFGKAKHLSDSLISSCENDLKLINFIKDEYKALVKLWIEIEYTVKAHDEIDMCKMRLEPIDPTQLPKGYQPTIYEIPIYDIDEKMETNYMELQNSMLELTRKLARLRYIKHLENDADPGACPICKHDPGGRYSVLECGHHLCIMCLQGMAKYQRNNLTCAVCRNRQKYKNVYYVTRRVSRPDSDGVLVKGEFSAKIEEILRIVLKLKLKDEKVKILIFSHWDSILRVIGDGLQQNGISFRLKWSPQSIEDFKNDELDITCMLMVLSNGSKGLNLIEATHVFLIEPILNPGEELQAIGRVHRMGQTKPTTVHRFIVKGTIEEKIYNVVSNSQTGSKWNWETVTTNNIKYLFSLEAEEPDDVQFSD